MTTSTKDPRTIITPDAFSVDPPLLGTPLAEPWRRGVALLVDVFFVLLITALTNGLWFIPGVIAAAFLFSRAREPGQDDRAAKVFRLFLGCMGVAVVSITLLVVIGIWYVNTDSDDLDTAFSNEDGAGPAEVASPGGSDGLAGAGGLRAILGGFQDGARLTTTDDPEEAVALTVDLGRRLFELTPDEDVEEVLRGLIPDEVGNVTGDEILARAMTELDASLADAAGTEVVDPAAVELAQALDVAGDTIGELERDLARANRDLEETRVELDEARQRGGLVGWFASRIDSLSFGFGWWTLYFALLMPWMKGQTPGKRIMGVRVVRLDGHPVTWWHAFERAGGYAAGLATGTLGFAQIYWDANRQAIHDKVAGTVVIRDGVPKVPGNWELAATPKPTEPDPAGPPS